MTPMDNPEAYEDYGSHPYDKVTKKKKGIKKEEMMDKMHGGRMQ